MSSGETAIASTNSYTVGATAIEITLPLFTQDLLCGYTETKTCSLGTVGTACPSWITTDQVEWIIYCTSPATCPAGTYNLILQAKLSNAGATTAPT